MSARKATHAIGTANLAAYTGTNAPTKPGTLEDAEAKLRAAGIVFDDAADFTAADLPQPDWIIPGLIAKGMKVDIYGKSKTRKSFFSLQLAECVAAGRSFLKWEIPTPRRTVYFNLELMPFFQQERMRKQENALGVELRGRLRICNLRGNAAILRDHAPELVTYFGKTETDLVIIDPRYKLLTGDEDENKAAGLRAILDFRDEIIKACACIMVTHDPKGDAGGKSISDRGAGSYTAGADVDYSLAISEHANGDNMIVVEDENRNRRRVLPFTAKFDTDRQIFTVDEDTQPLKATRQQFGGRQKTPTEKAEANAERQKSFRAAALLMLQERGDNLMGATEFKSEIKKRPGGAAFGEKELDRQYNALLERGEIERVEELYRTPDNAVKTKPKKKGGRIFIATPDQAKRYRAKFEGLGIC